jgi:hypothetical protein
VKVTSLVIASSTHNQLGKITTYATQSIITHQENMLLHLKTQYLLDTNKSKENISASKENKSKTSTATYEYL